MSPATERYINRQLRGPAGLGGAEVKASQGVALELDLEGLAAEVFQGTEEN